MNEYASIIYHYDYSTECHLSLRVVKICKLHNPWGSIDPSSLPLNDAPAFHQTNGQADGTTAIITHASQHIRSIYGTETGQYKRRLSARCFSSVISNIMATTIRTPATTDTATSTLAIMNECDSSSLSSNNQ